MLLGQDPLSDNKWKKTPHDNALGALTNLTIKPTITSKLQTRANAGSNWWALGRRIC